jgi:hypothetical protein
MGILMIGAVVSTLCVAFVLMVIFSKGVGQKTCRGCGAGLPVVWSSNQSHGPGLGEWACPECGRWYDRQARALNRAPN